MTFKEAKEFKKELGYDKFNKSDFEFRVFVTPSSNKDLNLYYDKIRGLFNELTDDDAVYYSTNNDYKVQGLTIYDGNLIFKNIEINS